MKMIQMVFAESEMATTASNAANAVKWCLLLLLI